MMLLTRNVADELDDARTRARLAQEESARLRVVLEAHIARLEERINGIELKQRMDALTRKQKGIKRG